MTEFDADSPLRQRLEAALKAAASAHAPETEIALPLQALLHDLTLHESELARQRQDLLQSREVLAASLARYEDLCNRVSVGCCTVDAAGFVLACNAVAANMLGQELGLMLGRPFVRFVLDEDADAFLQCSEAVWGGAAVVEPTTGHPDALDRDLRMVREDGRWFAVQMRLARILVADGQRAVHITFSHAETPTTALNGAAVELGQISSKLVGRSDGADPAPDGREFLGDHAMLCRVVDGFGPNVFVGLLSTDGRLLMVNQAALVAGSVRWSEVANQPIDRAPWFRHSEATQQQMRDAVRLASQGIPSRFDMQICGEDERVLTWVDFSLQPVLNDSGEVSHLVPSALVVQDRKQAEEQLLESEMRLAGIVDMALDAIITVDAAQTIVVFNPAAEAMFRMPQSEALGLPLERFIPARFRTDHRRHMERFSLGKGWAKAMMASRPVLGVRADGQEFPLEASISHGKVGEAQLFTVVLRDITERLQAEREKLAIEEQLRQSQKIEAIGTLAGGIAHDFNNALAVIQGNTQLAMEDVGGNELAQQSLAEIQKASTRARNLVQQILSFSRRQATQYVPVALAPVVEESVRLLTAAVPARVSFQVDFDDDVPVVMADAGQIEQILINLCTNALQAIGQQNGRIVIRLDAMELDATYVKHHPSLLALHAKRPGPTVRLSVSDTGPGMDAATLDRIFEPFFTTKPVGSGTGLGLSVVHGITQSHGGAIEVASQPGQGTVFTLYLPAARDPSAQPLAQEPALQRVAGSPAGGNERVLYIDDEESLATLAKRLLESHGYRVTSCSDPLQALELLRADPQAFDVVITDYNMPGMSGLDVARKVREIRSDLPVAIASGFADETLQMQYAEAGVQEIVSKLGAMEGLRAAIESALKPGRPA
jgi:two-component system, cell cycle sensor histidine kinase and response regulator CckA